MTSWHFKDPNSEEARSHLRLAGLNSKVIRLVRRMTRTPRAERRALVNSALQLIQELVILKEANIPRDEIDELSTNLAHTIRHLGEQSDKGSGDDQCVLCGKPLIEIEHLKEVSEGKWCLYCVGHPISQLNALCDCLDGMTKASRLALKEIVNRAVLNRDRGRQ